MWELLPFKVMGYRRFVRVCNNSHHLVVKGVSACLSFLADYKQKKTSLV